MSTQKVMFENEVKGIQRDTLKLMVQVAERSSNSDDSIRLSLGVIDCRAVVSRKGIIALLYERHVANLELTELQRPLGFINPDIQTFLDECQKYVWAKETVYNRKRGSHIKPDDNVRAAELDQIITFTPAQATVKFNLFCQKVRDDISKNDAGIKYASKGMKFADYLTQIAGFACAAQSYENICLIALKKFNVGNTEGCKNLMAEILEDPNVKEFRDFDYTPNA
ncbi:hypothetical protein H4219_005698 [Mycoemilia scoparia]|uniref:Uncharacterized protein n=1 Tax=Mycoemilia scoparia TaxID=417184 RepID=A0A9W7ZTJ6_9FUNG|nr:hypothetical protein H4219_005698 [Mycoemilia scoparia]